MTLEEIEEHCEEIVIEFRHNFLDSYKFLSIEVPKLLAVATAAKKMFTIEEESIDWPRGKKIDYEDHLFSNLKNSLDDLERDRR